MKIFNVRIEDPQGIYEYEMSDHFQYFFQEIINIMQCYIENNKPYCGEYDLKIINLLRNSFLEGNTSIYDKPHKTLFEIINKDTPQKPILFGDGVDNKGNIILDHWDCPCCGETYELDYDQYNYCPHCGQKIDWS
mgnify:CR=1 FL=1